ncbi:uncharacterized protein METZ01_LOCUS383908, partial [marine metagenome]
KEEAKGNCKRKKRKMRILYKNR